MRSNSIFTTVILAGTGFAAMSADKLVASLDDITQKLTTTNDEAKALMILSTQPTIDAYNALNAAGRLAIINIGVDPVSYPEDEQAQICTTFRNSASTHETLLNTLIDKSSLELGPFAAPIAEVIQDDETIYDTLCLAIGDIVPSCIDEIKTSCDNLESKFIAAKEAYGLPSR